MAMIPNILLDALIFSNLLTLMAVGLTLTYITLKVPNFSHGDFVTFGVYVSYSLYIFMKINPYFSLPIAFLTSGFVAVLMYYLVFLPLNKRGISVVGLMIASIAIEIILRCSMHIYSSICEKVSKESFHVFSTARADFFVDLGTIRVPGIFFVSFALIIVLLISLHLFLTKTKTGISMRASVENPHLARVFGVNVERTYALAWFLAGGLAGMAGTLLPFRIPCDPEIGWLFCLKIFAATILGGFTNIYGAFLGSYLVGMAETLIPYYLAVPPFSLSPAYRPAIPFIILILTLIFIPRGLTSVRILRRKGK